LERFLERSVELLDGDKPVFGRMIVPKTFHTCRVNPNVAINWCVDPNLEAFPRYAGNIS
jgi:hypothetical protein